MKKIPVGATIAHAYRFAFGDFFNLLKLTWVPLAATTVLSMALSREILDVMQSIQTHALPSSWPLLLLLYPIALVALVMQVTALFQYALGQIDMRQRWYYLAPGRPLLRMIGALLLLLVTLFGILVLYVIAIAIVLFLFRLGLTTAHIADTAVKAILGMDVALAILIGYGFGLFCIVRLGFLLGAVTIAENRIALGRSWSLSRGNFWRIFVIGLAIIVPFTILQCGYMYEMGLFHLPPPGITQAEAQMLQQQQTLAAMNAMQHYWYAYYPLVFGACLLLYGMLTGAQAFAWRALAQIQPDAI